MAEQRDHLGQQGREKGRQSIEIFCCYSRKDQNLLQELEYHLMPLQREGLIDIWNDTCILPGADWKKEISKHINTAQIILLLISPSFMASEYCYNQEMIRAMERHDSGSARVIPIIIRPVHWQSSIFGRLQALPVDAKPVTSWHNLDEAFFNIVQGIRSVINELVLEGPKELPSLGFMKNNQVSVALSDVTLLQTVNPANDTITPELYPDSLRLSGISSVPLGELQKLQPQLPLAHQDEIQTILKSRLSSSPEEKLSTIQRSRVRSSQLASPAPVEAMVPPSHGKRISRRTFTVTLLCFALLVSLAGGGAWTYAKQQQQLNFQHATATAQAAPFAAATAQAAPFATATAAVNAYNTASAANVIQFGFDAQHTNNNPYERILSPLTVKHLVQAWTAQTDDIVDSTPAVANGVVYISSRDKKLYALKANGCGQTSCAPLWTAQTSGRVYSSPAVANGVVYIGSTDGKLYALKADGCGQPTCAPLWTARTSDWTFASPAVVNGVVYVDSVSGKLYALKANGCGQTSCAPLWTAQIGFPSDSSPAVANGVVYIGSIDGKLYALKADGCGQPTCTPLWTAQTGSPPDSSPAVANGVVYIGSGDNKLYAFKAEGCGQASCAPLWTAQTSGWVYSPAVANGVVYIGSDDNKLYAFKAEGCGQASCAPLWTAQTSSHIQFSPTVANGVVYVSSLDLYAFKAEGCGQPTCAPLWTAQAGYSPTSSPAVGNGMVYVGSADGKLYVFHL